MSTYVCVCVCLSDVGTHVTNAVERSVGGSDVGCRYHFSSNLLLSFDDDRFSDASILAASCSESGSFRRRSLLLLLLLHDLLLGIMVLLILTACLA